MTHGNVFDHFGTCPVCQRERVELTDRGMCVDEFACYTAWVRSQS
jgi:hypothetical protein